MKLMGLFLVVVTTLIPAFQLLAIPGITDQTALLSQYFGIAALMLMSWGQLLSTRLRGTEAIFGGLDRIYFLHKWAGIVAMGAILLHDTIDPEMRGLGPETSLSDLAESLGETSFYGLLVLVAITVATFVPYHWWKLTHKAMGAMFAIATMHFFLIPKPFLMNGPIGMYVGFFCLAGIAAYMWSLLPDHMRPSRRYRITDLEKTGGALAITMKPDENRCLPEPGQFGMLQFTGSGNDEAHPFSFSKINPDGSLRVTIKPSGDFTNHLADKLALGQEVRMQGPFGRFRLSGKNTEIWIAGGIGITPFLAWADALDKNSGQVDLFYCVRSKTDAPHLAELQAQAARRPNLTLHLIISGEGRRLSAKQVAETVGADLSATRVSFCGPDTLRRVLQSGLRRYGVKPRSFRYEEFEFRTGIGLKRLAHWVLRRRPLRLAHHRPLSS